ncbi:DNA adenine methylase [Aliterella atlantica]|uniref:Site-specific DNA-methyltransferase (adenine-specific) n=1 Tax=Aliterella atlantica CENA595 TaxID=1618023 RepID=A0A0D9A078_9CYAN|nr:DNA adenine methylase [Aliterella atlantica]KJH72866.1 DNA methyltransferase [Aliterella atlantica CENA595]
MLSVNARLGCARPFLKWAGGKGKLIEQFVTYFPDGFDRYYEPFLGGGAVFFYLGDRFPHIPKFVSDVNPDLINAYLCVRDDVDLLISLLNEHQLKHSKEYYYQVRANKFKNAFEQAARLIYLNKTCFNGLYRENSKGEFNVPLGKYKNPNICNVELLRCAAIALQDTDISVRHFVDVLDRAEIERDFVYFDPPYYPLNSTSNFTSYSRDFFGESEQTKLRDTFKLLAERGVKVMSSNSDCAFVRELYAEFNIHEILAARAINSRVSKRGKITELLITSY